MWVIELRNYPIHPLFVLYRLCTVFFFQDDAAAMAQLDAMGVSGMPGVLVSIREARDTFRTGVDFDDPLGACRCHVGIVCIYACNCTTSVDALHCMPSPCRSRPRKARRPNEERHGCYGGDTDPASPDAVTPHGHLKFVAAPRSSASGKAYRPCPSSSDVRRRRTARVAPQESARGSSSR